MLIDDLCDRLLPAAAGRHVTDVRIGLGYTAVLLDSGRCGLAYTFRQATGPHCTVIEQAGTLSGRPAADIAVLAKAADPVSAAVGLAVLNALTDPPAGDPADVLDMLSVAPDDEIGMVGNFRPLVNALRPRAKALHVFERNPPAGSALLPASSAPDILPRCRVAIVTATSLLNRTIDELLGHCRQAREVVVLGPSTPLQTDIWIDRGVTVLSGVDVTDPPLALRIVSEGGGTPQLRPAIRKVGIRISGTAAPAGP